MDDAFLQMLRDWQTYYFLTGSASAGLIGLLFVAVSLATTVVTPTSTTGTTEGVHTWATPIIVHFSGALFISALLIMPTLTPASLGVILTLAAIACLVYLARTAVRLGRQQSSYPVDTGDWIWNIVIPVAGHLLILGTALTLLANTSQNLNAVAVAVAALIATGIRNTWDLTVWLAAQRGGG